MLSTGRRAATLCLAAVAVLGTGCETNDSEPRATPSAVTTHTPTDDATAGTPTHARLLADPNSGYIACVGEVAEGGRVSLYDPTVVAHGDVTIVDAKIAGNGVRLLDAESVTTLAPVSNGPGALTDDEWPLTLSTIRPGAVDKDTRQALVGSTVGDGTRILPLISVEKTKRGGADAGALVLSYLTEGDETERTERLPLELSLPAGRCP